MKILKACLILGVLSLSLPASAGDMVAAKKNYDRFCASCHGFNGMSVMPDAPSLRMNQGLMQGDLQIIQKLKQGGPRKPPFIGLLSDADLQDVITYSRTIR